MLCRSLNTPTKTATMEATAEQTYETICAVVIWLIWVGTEVPSGQLWEEEHGRHVDSENWPENRC